MKKVVLVLAFALTFLLVATAGTAGAGKVKKKPVVDRADIMGQGEVGVEAKNGAKVIRTGRWMQFRMKMATPEPGSYTYPTAAPGTPPIAPGWPEVFTGWAFVFNFPDKCNGPCDLDDLGPTTGAQGGAYQFDGKLVWRKTLRLSGGIRKGAMSGNPPGIDGVRLQNPRGAEVHLAIAPHGMAIREQIAAQTSMPAGNPACACWWVAVVKK